MCKAFSMGRQVKITRVISIMAVCMEKEFIPGWMAKPMRGSGMLIRCKGMGLSLRLTIGYTLGNIRMIKNRGMGSSSGLMEGHTKDIG